MGKWTRRGFIAAGVVAGGALAVGVAIRPGNMSPKLAKYVVDGDEQLLAAWVKVSPDNLITAVIPHAEMGQGVHTALMQMLAEEMDADWDNLTFMEAPPEKDYVNYPLGREFILDGKQPPGWIYDTLNGAFLQLAKGMDLQMTGGSTSVRFTGTGAMQNAGAAAREMIMKAAAKAWDVPVKDLRTEKSHVYHDASNRSGTYGEFALEAAQIEPSLQPKLKARKDYKLMGESVPRVDIPAKVDGTAMFAMDISVPGMKYATVRAAPVLGETVSSVDGSAAKSMPGVMDVLDMGDFVAVVADSYWQARQAIDTVDITFTSSASDKVSDASIMAQYREAMDTGKQKKMFKTGNIDSHKADAKGLVEAEYTVPYLAHACMEPMSAVAWVREGKCDLWVGSQNPLGHRASTAETLGIDMENVAVHNQFLGGGFGRRANPDFTDQAVRISAETGLPIKLIWSREEDIQHDHYRPSGISRIRAAVDKKGMPITWDSLFVHKHDPKEAALVIYDVPNQYIRYVDSPTHIRFGPWRSVDHTQHGFYTESFMDELAHEAGEDPYKYRRKLLANNPRCLKVLDAAAKLAGWGKELPSGQAQGISIVESFMTIVAEVVTVDMNGPEPKVVHVACAADAGMAINPDGFKAQMESGIIYGLTAALYGEISIADGAIEQSNFHDYRMVRMDDAPDIDVVIIESDARIGGAGEPGTPPIAPALTNAIFAATGKRLRSLPVSKHEFGDAS